MRAHVINGENVGMIQCAGSLRLLFKTAKRYSARQLGLQVSVQDDRGSFVAAQVTGTVGSLRLDTRASTANGVPATWTLVAA